MVAVDVNAPDLDWFVLAAFNDEQMRSNSLFPGLPTDQSYRTFLTVGLYDPANRVGWLKIAPEQNLSHDTEFEHLKLPYSVKTVAAALFLCCEGDVQKILKMHGDGFSVPKAVHTRMHPKLCFRKPLGGSPVFFLKE